MDSVKRVLVYGDAIVDRYDIVTPLKPSAEAPVLVCRQESTSYRPGGAANVAVNVASMGPVVTLLSYGSDDADHDVWLADELEGVMLFQQIYGRASALKTRIVDAHFRQLLRIDDEATNLPEVTAQYLLDFALNYISNFDVICISDYAKGCADHDMLRKLIYLAEKHDKYVVVNSKPSNIHQLVGASLIVVNFSEAVEALNLLGNPQDESWKLAPAGVALGLSSRLDDTPILLTKGEEGMWLADESVHHTYAHPVQVADITGAGDTVVATIAAHGCHTPEVLKLAARNAASVVTKQGVATP